MKIDNIISGAKDLITRSGLKIKEHSPELLLIAGVGGIIAGTVLACRATIKAQKIKEEMRTSFKEIDDCLADESLAEVYTEEDAKTDRRRIRNEEHMHARRRGGIFSLRAENGSR